MFISCHLPRDEENILYFIHVFFYFNYSFYRTITNIAADDSDEDYQENGSNVSDENTAPMKRRRSSSSGDQLKVIAHALKENGIKRNEIIQQIMEPARKEQTELELFFCSICKTVEKLSPLEQAKLKMQISNLVSHAELSQLENSQKFHSIQPQNSNPNVNNYLYAGQGIPMVPPNRTEFAQLQNSDGITAKSHYNAYQYPNNHVNNTVMDNENGQTYSTL